MTSFGGDAQVWSNYSLIFFVGMLIFIFIAFRKNLYKFTGTRHKTRVIYGTAASIFLTSVLLYQFDINSSVIGKSLIVGIVISLPWIFYEKKRYDKIIVGTTIATKPMKQSIHLLLLVLLSVGLQLFYDSDIGRMVSIAKWPLLGLSFAWVIVQIFLLYYFNRIEKKVGGPIMENNKSA
jgi:hypothetical protein